MGEASVVCCTPDFLRDWKVDRLMQRIPLTIDYLFRFDGNCLDLLPRVMRNPIVVNVATTGPVSLAGLSHIDGVPGAEDMPVLVMHQPDPVENGHYLMREHEPWERATVPDKPQGEPLGFHRMYYVVKGTANAATYFWVISPDPHRIGLSEIKFEKFGKTLFDDHMAEAERAIIEDLDRPHRPIPISFVGDNYTLVKAKAYKTLEILSKPSTTGTVAGTDPDRHERLAAYWHSLYKREMESRTIRLQDQARLHGTSRRGFRR